VSLRPLPLLLSDTPAVQPDRRSGVVTSQFDDIMFKGPLRVVAAGS